MRLCSYDGCKQQHSAKGFCRVHYIRHRVHGDPAITLLPRNRVCSVVDCYNKHEARGYCTIHYWKYRTYGDALHGYNEEQDMQALIVANCDHTVDGCLVWRGDRTKKGFGMVTHNKRTMYVHRLAYMAFIGYLANTQFVLHRCGNLVCCNPLHLYLGTLAEAKKIGYVSLKSADLSKGVSR